MRERDDKRSYFTVRGKAEGDDLDDVVAAVVVKNGRGGIAADDRLTVPMLAILCRRHKLEPRVTGGSFALDSETFVRGDGGSSFDALPGMVNADDGSEIILYTYPLLHALAEDLTSNARWDLPA